MLESRLETNKWVAAVGDVSYYTFMDSNSKVIKKMQNQSRHITIGGPWCVDGKLWWKLQSKKNFSGYVIEVDRESYHLQVIQ